MVKINNTDDLYPVSLPHEHNVADIVDPAETASNILFGDFLQPFSFSRLKVELHFRSKKAGPNSNTPDTLFYHKIQ